MAQIGSLEDNVVGGINVFGSKKVKTTHVKRTASPQRTADVARVKQRITKQVAKDFNANHPVQTGPKTKPEEVARTLVNLGNFKFNKGDFNGAISAYNGALSVVPNYPPAYVGLADAYDAYGFREDAIKYAQKSVATNPKSRKTERFITSKVLSIAA
jgi:tetratricopeptide (TPR) repeat protein